jgi:hypothetical protein
VKTASMAGWHEARVDLGKYLELGDAVSEDMADYFLGVLPPAMMRHDLIQIGEPNDHINGRATFATIYRKRGGGGTWIWAGMCHRGETTEPSVKARTTDSRSYEDCHSDADSGL